MLCRELGPLLAVCGRQASGVEGRETLGYVGKRDSIYFNELGLGTLMPRGVPVDANHLIPGPDLAR